MDGIGIEIAKQSRISTGQACIMMVIVDCFFVWCMCDFFGVFFLIKNFSIE